MAKYFVSRQQYWGVDPEEGTIVEVAFGGSDYANPDMMSVRWRALGEGQEFDDPREAAQAAIDICNAWRNSGESNAKVAYGNTGGSTMPFDAISFEEIRQIAELHWEKVPKCDQCGEVLGRRTYTHELAIDSERFCSSNCADIHYQDCLSAD